MTSFSAMRVPPQHGGEVRVFGPENLQLGAVLDVFLQPGDEGVFRIPLGDFSEPLADVETDSFSGKEVPLAHRKAYEVFQLKEDPAVAGADSLSSLVRDLPLTAEMPTPFSPGK